MYSVSIATDKEKKVAKGVKKALVDKEISHNNYKQCLMSSELKDNQQRANFNLIRSQDHNIRSINVTKISLCCYDDKRALINNIDSYAHGHYLLKK